MDLIKAIQAETVQIREEKIKKKARRWSLLALLLLLIMFFLPWLSNKVVLDKDYEQVVLIEFDQDFREASSTERSSSKASSATEDTEPAEEVVEAVEEVVEPEPEPVKETKPEPKPQPKVEKVKITPTPQKPVLTSDAATRKIDKKVEKMLEEVSEKAKVKEVTPEITEVTEEVEVTDDFMTDLADYFKKSKSKKKTKPGGGKQSDKPDSGTSSTSGEGDSGTSDTGDSDTDGNGDAGDGGDAEGDFDGDGLLTRKVIFRPNIGELVKQTGKITVNLCVDRSGKVVFSEIDRAKSTIRDRAILKKAEIAASKYRYEKDFTVAERQCGKLSFIVKIQK